MGKRHDEAATYLQGSLPEELRRPKIAIICGSGLGRLAETVQESSKVEFDYAGIPHFPQSTGKGSIYPRGPSIQPCRNLVQCHADSWQSGRACRKIGLWVSGKRRASSLDGWAKPVSVTTGPRTQLSFNAQLL